MDTFPQLYTPRLLLRKLRVDDVPSLVKYANNRKISDNIINIPYPYEEPNAVFRISYVHQGFKNKTRYVFAIILKDIEELIGEISLHLGNDGKMAELGYWVAEPFWNKGIATEAISAVLKFGFQLGLGLVIATCHEDNIGSSRVLEKNAMIKGSTRGHVTQFSITKEQYEQLVSQQ